MIRAARIVGAIAPVVVVTAIAVAQPGVPATTAPVPADLPDWAYTPPPPPGAPPPPSVLPADDSAIVRFPAPRRP